MSKSANVTTVVKPCNCASEYQDRKYGKGRRVMNKGVRSGDSVDVKCTVCGAKYRVAAGKEDKSETTKAKGKAK